MLRRLGFKPHPCCSLASHPHKLLGFPESSRPPYRSASDRPHRPVSVREASHRGTELVCLLTDMPKHLGHKKALYEYYYVNM